ncbi:MAG TPA: type II toxin-antitoxin system RelE/ParE family toxin [Thermoanaerobaculia bacterium]
MRSRELRRLDRQVAVRIVDRIERDLASPDLRPLPLSGPFEGLFKLRVGDYRVIYALSEDSVQIIRIAHRRDVYR